MVKRKLISNLEIYNTANALIEAFRTDEQNRTNFPVKVNFFLQKNINSIIEIAQEIEKSRTEIVQKYGEPNPDNADQFYIPKESIDEATRELEDLFNLEQEVPVNMLELDWFDGIEMTGQQVSAISYMINDEE